MAFFYVSVLLFVFLSCFCESQSALTTTFYSTSCPNLTAIVKEAVHNAYVNEPRICASLLRLHFHDCFVNGCDASVLLDGPTLEQTAPPNNNSIRGMDVIDTIKAILESKCPGKVSCADILALVARDCVVELLGPTWTVYFGRRDSLNASQAAAAAKLPPPFFNVSQLADNFAGQGLDLKDLVALSGAHTVGQAQCFTFKNRLYGPFAQWDYMDPSYNTSLKTSCPSSGGDTNLSPLDVQTPIVFDNMYYINLLYFKGLLFSDQVLWSGGNWTTASYVHLYAMNQTQFFIDFAQSMIKMGNINPLTGSSGQIRKNCGVVNP